MIKRLTGQYNIIVKAAISSMAPSLSRLGFVLLGLILGLIWTYQFAPVKFTDAEPVHMADGYKDQWIKMVAVEYDQTGDVAEAERKLISGGVTPGMIQDLINANQATDALLASQLQQLMSVADQVKGAAADQADSAEPGLLDGILGPLLFIIVFAVLGVLVAAVLTLYFVIPIGPWAKKKSGSSAALTPGSGAAIHSQQVAAKKAVAEQKTDFAAVGETPPVSQHMSTYIQGDDLYDDSFSIETASGEFLGECGSGISETIGVGDPKKVTATEVWLFDKNDIRTVTKVLMSEHAYNDQALRTKLAPKGEAVPVSSEGITMLETQTLRVRVRVVDLQYGEGGPAANSFFERLTVELAAWPKEDGGAADEGGKPQPPEASAAFGDTAELLNY